MFLMWLLLYMYYFNTIIINNKKKYVIVTTTTSLTAKTMFGSWEKILDYLLNFYSHMQFDFIICFILHVRLIYDKLHISTPEAIIYSIIDNKIQFICNILHRRFLHLKRKY